MKWIELTTTEDTKAWFNTDHFFRIKATAKGTWIDSTDSKLFAVVKESPEEVFLLIQKAE